MMMRRALLAAFAALLFGCAPAASKKTSAPASEIVDLTHPLGPGSPYIHVRDATFLFRSEPIATIASRGVYANKWELTEHIGTHIDAPCHFAVGARCLDAIPLEDLFAEAVVIDLRERASKSADTELTAADLEAWQARHGEFPERSVVLLSSGWATRWSSQDAFANADASGTMHFPASRAPRSSASRRCRGCSASGPTRSRSILGAIRISRAIRCWPSPENGRSSVSRTSRAFRRRARRSSSAH
jgi:kynurenine formamidase